MKQVLNRTTAPQVVRFFDVCFKRGVIDAYELGDDLEAKDFLESRLEDWRFGVIGKPEDLDWQMFRFTMYFWARENHLTKFAEDYIFKVRSKNYTWCLLPYCLRFYLMGIKEWLDYPNPVNIEMFKHSSKVHWNPSVIPYKITTGDFISYMHEFAYDYRRRPEEDKEVSDTAMDSFCLAIFDLTRKYERHSEEDI